MEARFFICEHCGNLITFVENKGVPVMCCGQKMTELVPNTSDGAGEKHVPVVEIEGTKVHVKVGEVAHPMLAEHHIAWIAVQTNKGLQDVYKRQVPMDEQEQLAFAIRRAKLFIVLPTALLMILLAGLLIFAFHKTCLLYTSRCV